MLGFAPVLGTPSIPSVWVTHEKQQHPATQCIVVRYGALERPYRSCPEPPETRIGRCGMTLPISVYS